MFISHVVGHSLIETNLNTCFCELKHPNISLPMINIRSRIHIHKFLCYKENSCGRSRIIQIHTIETMRAPFIIISFIRIFFIDFNSLIFIHLRISYSPQSSYAIVLFNCFIYYNTLARCYQFAFKLLNYRSILSTSK
jgi:hypothetical protein